MAVKEKKYALVMKPGTAGTIEDPHRPDVADLLKTLGVSWRIDQRRGEVLVTCEEAKHNQIKAIRPEKV